MPYMVAMCAVVTVQYLPAADPSLARITLARWSLPHNVRAMNYANCAHTFQL